LRYPFDKVENEGFQLIRHGWSSTVVIAILGYSRAIVQRRWVFGSLGGEPASVGDIAAPSEMSLTAVSKHLKVLERVGLLIRSATGASASAVSTRKRRFTGIEMRDDHNHGWTSCLECLDEIFVS